MKFRTDFVTNSSSSSYIVSVSVKSSEGKIATLDWRPSAFDSEFSDDNKTISMASKIEDVADRIKQCTSTEELKNLLLVEMLNRNSLECIEDVIRGLDRDSPSFLADFKNKADSMEDPDDDPFYWLIPGVLKSIHEFESVMREIPSIDQIQRVTIQEDFEGWDEGGPDVLGDFLNRIVPGWDWDSEELEARLKGKLSDSEIEGITEWIDEDRGVLPDGRITTTISIADGSVQKEYRMSV